MSGSPPHRYQLTVWPLASARTFCQAGDCSAAAAAAVASEPVGDGAGPLAGTPEAGATDAACAGDGVAAVDGAALEHAEKARAPVITSAPMRFLLGFPFTGPPLWPNLLAWLG